MAMHTPDKIIYEPPGTMLLGPLAEKGVSLMRYHYKMTCLSTVTDHVQNSSLILLLNISGHARLSYYSKKEPLQNYHLPIAPQKVVLLMKKNGLFSMEREANEEHRFVILEISRTWLSSVLREYPHPTKKEISSFLKRDSGAIQPLLSPFCANA